MPLTVGKEVETGTNVAEVLLITTCPSDVNCLVSISSEKFPDQLLVISAFQ